MTWQRRVCAGGQQHLRMLASVAVASVRGRVLRAVAVRRGRRRWERQAGTTQAHYGCATAAQTQQHGGSAVACYDYAKKTLAEVPYNEVSGVMTMTLEPSPTTDRTSNKLAKVNASIAPSQSCNTCRERPESPTNFLLVLTQAVDGVSQAIEGVGRATILWQSQWVELIGDWSQRLVKSLSTQDGLLGPGDGQIECAHWVMRQLVALEDLVNVVHDLNDVVEGVQQWDSVRVIGDRLAVGLEENALEKPVRTYPWPT
ncbi:uncharacterized protein C8Q71DRAFT_727121 [Rhodofomes roseus]|uniref:Uncharacterized protein n=1 Tax=Rhodofomes roseus TaxID=34475 RepID=A0ABQ8K2E0_9APHY|nr:uncharacterized protein C8Q71DRAFT_727121 [Rhodofomes roseus]KAH9830930.1 hypothetical protein C8Q71DRAFT_727121 [Rhodofomes roseus]